MLTIEIRIAVADRAHEQGGIGRQLVRITDGLRRQTCADLAVRQEAEAEVLGIVHVLRRLEQRQLILARLGCIRAEGRAVAALVAHFVDVQNLMPSVGELDDDVCAVRAGIGAVFADRVAVEAAAALAAGAAGHVERALLGDGVGLGGIGLLGDLVGVRCTDDGLCKGSGVGNALDDGRGTAVRVTGGPDVFNVGLEGRALAAHFDAVFSHELRVDLLADGGEDEVARDLKRLAGGDGAAAAGSVGLAELHLAADQPAVLLLDRCGQLVEVHALVDGELQFMLVGGHFLLRAAVDDRGGGCAHALGDAGGIHRGVARADDDHVALEARLDLLLHFLHPGDDAADVAGLMKIMPFLSVCYVIAGLANLGLPGLSGFIAEMTIFVGSFQNNDVFHRTLTIIACSSIVITAVYILRLVGKILYGTCTNKHHLELTDATWDERVAVICLIVCVAGLGMAPFWVSHMIGESVLPVVSQLIP